jgi:hypothetical protein
VQRARLIITIAIVSTVILMYGRLVLAQTTRGIGSQARLDRFWGKSVPTASEELLFVSGGHSKATAIFNAQLEQVGAVSAPYGYFAVDGMRRFYDVPDNQSRLLIFAPPYQHLLAKLDFGEDTPEGIAVDAIHGIVAVPLEKYADGGSGPLYVNFYSITQSGLLLCDTVQTPDAGEFVPGAFDREGTLYLIDYSWSGYDGIATIPGGCKATASQFNTIPSQYNLYHGNVFVNSHDDIVFEGDINKVVTFAHPVNGAFGNPIAITTLNFQEEMFFQCFSSDGRHLWASPLLLPNPVFTEYNYPGGGTPLKHGSVANVGVCTPTPPVLP